jgi:hypothetical protein
MTRTALLLGLVLACGGNKPQAQDRDPTMDDLLVQQCDDGRNPQWCDALVTALERDGSPRALARARMIRARECEQGDKKSCG